MRIVSLVGNRPQFVKAAPLCIALRAQGEEILVHSGQHYDPELADLFFDELGIPSPDHALDVGPGTPVHQIAIMMERFEHVVRDEKPDAVLVYGDTTTTLAGALVAAKCGIPLAHVEAGLRSFDKTMPEEQNRVVTDHLSDVLLCPTRQAVDNLAAEGITRGVHLVGDVMFDAGRMFAPLAEHRGTLQLEGGSFDANGQSLVNRGRVEGYGTLRAGAASSTSETSPEMSGSSLAAPHATMICCSTARKALARSSAARAADNSAAIWRARTARLPRLDRCSKAAVAEIRMPAANTERPMTLCVNCSLSAGVTPCARAAGAISALAETSASLRLALRERRSAHRAPIYPCTQ